MGDAAPEFLRVLEISTSRGGGLESIEVDLPTAWARHHARVEVELSGGADDLGWHARLAGDEGEHLLGFPWHDHVDAILLGQRRAELPIDLEGGEWNDAEQGWWAAVIPHSSFVYLAEGDFDELIDNTRDRSNLRPVRPGLVEVDGAMVRWSRVERAAYDAAWRRAIAHVAGMSHAGPVG